MSARPPPPTRHPAILVGAVLGYLALAAWGASRSLDLLDPDLPSYLLHAEHLANGRTSLGISGMRSPLFIWLIALLHGGLGLDTVVAARGVVVAAGVPYLVGCWRLTLHAQLTGTWLAVAMIACAAMAAEFVQQRGSPDLLLAGLLCLYLDQVLRGELWARPGRAFGVGVLAGAAYLCKSFALPFTAVHLVGAAALEAASAPARQPGRRYLRALCAAGLGWALLAVPWIWTLSAHFGPAFTTMGRNAHSTFSPPEVFARNFKPSFDGLWVPEPGRRAFWEEPPPEAFTPWSPLDSPERFVFKVAIVVNAVLKTRDHVLKRDPLGLRLVALLGLAFLALVGPRRWRWRAAMALWPVLLYFAGYLPFFSWERRFFWFPLTVLTLAAVGLGRGLAAGRRQHEAASALAVMALTASFTMASVLEVALKATRPERGQAYRPLARALRDAGLTGPLASTDPQRGWPVSYFSGSVFLGRPGAEDPPALVRELRLAGAEVLLSWTSREAEVDLASVPELVEVKAFEAGSLPGLVEEVRIYRVLPGAPVAQRAPGPVAHPRGERWGDPELRALQGTRWGPRPAASAPGS